MTDLYPSGRRVVGVVHRRRDFCVYPLRLVSLAAGDIASLLEFDCAWELVSVGCECSGWIGLGSNSGTYLAKVILRSRTFCSCFLHAGLTDVGESAAV
jgi:hypothetical protein